MKKGPIIILTALFASLFCMPFFVEAKAFSWSLESSNHQTVSAPGGTASLGTTVNISSVWTYGWKDSRRCKTSFVTELLRNGQVVSTMRCDPLRGCVKSGNGIGTEWITTGCVQYCYGGCLVGPSLPSVGQTVLADTIRARLCYAECSGGGSNKFEYDEFVGHGDRISTVFVEDAEKDLGPIGSFVDTTGANSVRVFTSTPGVLLWVGGIDDKTKKSATSMDGDVWACVDNDKNNLCDGNEGASHSCLASNGDWYRSQCCGTVNTCGYSAQAKAFCGNTAAGDWEWAPLDEPGQIHVLDGCPGTQLVSNGSVLFSCGKQVTGAQQMPAVLRVNVSGIVHAFSCANNVISECSGCADPSQCAFSSVNAMPIGSRAPGTGPTFYCSSDGDWTTDLDSKDEQSCTAAGFSWTGTLCCGEADDAGEYYNDPSYPNAPGGCWNRQMVLSGNFALPDRVINYKGEFFGCRLTAAADSNTLSLIDTHKSAPNNGLVNNSILPCGAFLPNAQPGGLPNAVCRPDGRWMFTNETFGIYNKSIGWTAALNFSRASLSGCCPLDNCWNGTSCRPRGSFYRIGEQGFLCDLPSGQDWCAANCNMIHQVSECAQRCPFIAPGPPAACTTNPDGSKVCIA